MQAPRTGPTHVGFSGGNFSSDEINNLGRRVFDVQDFPTIEFTEEEPRLANSRILSNSRGYIFPKLISAINKGNVSYTLKTYHIDKTITYTNNAGFAEEVSRGRADEGYKIFELTTPSAITDLGLSDTFAYKMFKGEVDPSRRDTSSVADDSKFHAEVATDYASDNTKDYLHFGWWVLIPKQTASLKGYDLGVFADAAHDYPAVARIFNRLTGTATYAGSMMGLHAEVESNGKTTLSRLTGKATLTADFGNNSAPGSLAGTFNELKLNGTAATGSITFQDNDIDNESMAPHISARGANQAIINGITYLGRFGLTFIGSGPRETNKPTGIIGTLRGVTSDGSKAFAAAFGARKEE